MDDHLQSSGLGDSIKLCKACQVMVGVDARRQDGNEEDGDDLDTNRDDDDEEGGCVAPA